jgi:hypothetical protein
VTRGSAIEQPAFAQSNVVPAVGCSPEKGNLQLLVMSAVCVTTCRDTLLPLLGRVACVEYTYLQSRCAIIPRS